MPEPSPTLHFADFRLDPDSGELTRGGRPIPLEHQPARVLARLAASAGRLVTRQELAAGLWEPGTHVNFDDGLNYCIRQIRAALDDDARAPRFVATLPRRGYRFIAPVTHARRGQPSRSRRLAVAAGLAALVTLTAIAESRPNNHHAMAVAIVTTLHDLLF